MTQSLFVAWRSGDAFHGRWGPVGRLDRPSPLEYRFGYTRGAQTLEGFEPFPCMPRLDEVYESEELFPLFANRLLSESRPEYEAYLEWGGFDPSSPPDPIVVLGVTEGRRATDSLEVFPCPLPDREGCYVNKFFVHGLRWVGQEGTERVGRLRPEDSLTLRPEPDNPYDPFAVAVAADDGTPIGYVPRYLARDTGSLLADCQSDFIQLAVERVNLRAPLQQRILCRMRACWPGRFTPCASAEFQLIVPEPLSVMR